MSYRPERLRNFTRDKILRQVENFFMTLISAKIELYIIICLTLRHFILYQARKEVICTMKEFKYVITDPVGIHARPAGLLVKEAKNFKSVATFIKGDKSAKATALMKLMGMGIVQGDEVTVRVEGEDEEACAAAIEKFLKENF